MKLTCMLAALLLVVTTHNNIAKPSSQIDNYVLSSMPEPARIDARLERSMKNKINFMGWTEKCLKVVITKKDWTVKKDENGKVVGREIEAFAALKQKGKILYQTYNFTQNYRDGEFRKLNLELKTSTTIPYLPA